MSNVDDLNELGGRIYMAFTDIIRHARSKEELDEIYDTLLDAISDDFFILYYGDSHSSKPKANNNEC